MFRTVGWPPSSDIGAYVQARSVVLTDDRRVAGTRARRPPSAPRRASRRPGVRFSSVSVLKGSRMTSSDHCGYCQASVSDADHLIPPSRAGLPRPGSAPSGGRRANDCIGGRSSEELRKARPKARHRGFSEADISCHCGSHAALLVVERLDDLQLRRAPCWDGRCEHAGDHRRNRDAEHCGHRQVERDPGHDVPD